MQHPSAADVVERLGFGLAQWRVLLLGSSIWLVDGIFLSLTSALASSIAKDFGVGPYERALLPSLEIVGVALGSFAGGYVGDHVGRKPPIVATYLSVGFLSAGLGLAWSFWQVLIGVMVIGFSMGLAMPCSLVMQSELSPSKWRMVSMTVRLVLGTIGSMLASGLLVVQDPAMLAINWRWCYGACTPLGIAMGAAAAALLPESPVFLASVGEHRLAKQGFESMARLNGVDAADADVATEAPEVQRGPKGRRAASLPVVLQVQVILGPGVLTYTLAATLACFAYNLLAYGHNYAEPQVLVVDTARRLPPAWQLFLESCWYMPGALLMVPLDRFAGSRKLGAASCYAGCGVCLALFAAFVNAPVRWRNEAIFQGSACGIRIMLKVATCFSQQISAEMYPPLLAATGSAFCVGSARAAAILAPLLFEAIRGATVSGLVFYDILAAFSIFTACALAVLLPTRLEEVRDAAERACAELKPLQIVAKDSRLV